jgi:hypothetical protein
LSSFIIISSIAVILSILFISFVDSSSVYSQSTSNVSSNDNVTSEIRTPINLTAVVINSTESMKEDLIKLSQIIQNGNVTNAPTLISKLNDSVEVLYQCATLPFIENFSLTNDSKQ